MGAVHDSDVVVVYAPELCGAAAGPVQPQAPRGRIGCGLPLLPRFGGEVVVRRRAADADLHDVPFADLDERFDAGAGARELSRR